MGESSRPPGTTIATSPAAARRYIGSPSITRAPDGALVASHDYFGPMATHRTRAETRVYRSEDQGETWRHTTTFNGLFWASLFTHAGGLYILGTHHEYGPLIIRRSDDSGYSWTGPRDSRSGILAERACHTAPMPVLEHNGRLWRSVEYVESASEKVTWGRDFQAAVMSIGIDDDLLNARCWTFSEGLPSSADWRNGCTGWLEGNAVAMPDGSVVDMMRFEVGCDRAALVHVSEDGRTLQFDPASDMVPFPGGMTKFAVRRDPRESGLWWTLANDQSAMGLDRPPRPGEMPSGAHRNILVLASSADLREWTVRATVLSHPDWQRVAFQYPDFIFDGDDLLVASRTAWGNAHAPHDANFLTFHRVAGFRQLAG